MRGRRIQGASACAREAMNGSSAEVSSMRRVKCVVMASRVAMFARRSCPRVFWRTEMRVWGEVEESGVR